jgi:ATP-binding cassette subfamily B protein
LVLDEATANLDVGTEAMIQEALERLLEDRTAIIIAHRLSTIRNVDRILVLKHGELVEQGSHEQLLAQEGLYSSLYRLQRLGA